MRSFLFLRRSLSIFTLVFPVIDARRRLRELEEEAALADGRPREARRVLSKEERAAAAADRLASENKRHQEFSLAFLKLERLERAMEGRDDEAMGEWLEVATYLVDSFRETRQLFPSDSKKKFTGVLSRHWKRKGAAVDLETQAGVMASRLERSMGAFSFLPPAGKLLTPHPHRSTRRGT